MTDRAQRPIELRTKTRRLKVGPLVYRSERLPSGQVLRRITWHAQIKWDNQR